MEDVKGIYLAAGSRLIAYPVARFVVVVDDGCSSTVTASLDDDGNEEDEVRTPFKFNERCNCAIKVVLPLPAIPTTITQIGSLLLFVVDGDSSTPPPEVAAAASAARRFNIGILSIIPASSNETLGRGVIPAASVLRTRYDCLH